MNDEYKCPKCGQWASRLFGHTCGAWTARDRNGLTLHADDWVTVNTGGADGDGLVIAADTGQARRLQSVLVEFENGSRQWMGCEHLKLKGGAS